MAQTTKAGNISNAQNVYIAQEIHTAQSGDEVNVGECPICGAVNPPDKTFRCKHCNRPYICLKHQNLPSYWCDECVAQPDRPSAPDLFQLNYQFVYPYLPMKSEALAQVLVNFTSGAFGMLIAISQA